MVHECQHKSRYRLIRGLPLFVLLISDSIFPQLTESRQSTNEHNIQATSPDEGDPASHKNYINKDGKTVHSSAKSNSGSIPAGNYAQCRDGSYSFSHHHSGTFSQHCGVSCWL
jgi:Protein of unknown function (DUF3761)